MSVGDDTSRAGAVLAAARKGGATTAKPKGKGKRDRVSGQRWLVVAVAVAVVLVVWWQTTLHAPTWSGLYVLLGLCAAVLAVVGVASVGGRWWAITVPLSAAVGVTAVWVGWGSVPFLDPPPRDLLNRAGVAVTAVAYTGMAVFMLWPGGKRGTRKMDMRGLAARLKTMFRRPTPGKKRAPGVDLTRLPVATIVGERRRWRIPFAGSHVLIVGATGSGKGSVIWSTVKAAAPHIKSGLVRLIGIDPKGGMELGVGERMLHSWEYGEGEGWQERVCELLESLVVEMQARAGRMRKAGLRKHHATVEEPLQVIIIDELLTLTAMVNDTDLRKRIMNALLLLLSQGRAPGFVVIAATQEPSKELLNSVRGFFPTRVCLRVVDWRHVDMALGQGSRERGAQADKVAPDEQGTGYVYDEGTDAMVQVRFDWVSDEAIRELASTYPARRHVDAAEPGRGVSVTRALPALGDGVETAATGVDDTLPQPVPILPRVRAVWPRNRTGAQFSVMHVDELVALLGIGEGELTAALAGAGIVVEVDTPKKRDGVTVRRPGVRWSVVRPPESAA